MTSLSNLTNTHRPHKRMKKVGRGPGSGMGKTSTRGHKGQKSRSGYKKRLGQEGGQLPLYRKLPTRGFSQARFKKEVYSLNLSRINDLFEDGEIVSIETLQIKGCLTTNTKATFKVLGCGELTKKVILHAHAYSASAKAKLEKQSIEFKIHD